MAKPIDNLPLAEVLAARGVESYDAVFVGDGSGTTWSMGAGWAVVVHDRHTQKRKLLWGGLSLGTVGIAELVPYAHALAWYDAPTSGGGGGGSGLRHRLGRLLQVHILSDNENVVLQGREERGRHRLAPWWATLAALQREGYVLHWHHVHRDTLPLNRLVDDFSRQTREAVEALDFPGRFEGRSSLYDANP